MLVTGGGGLFGLSVTLCSGQSGSNAPDGLDPIQHHEGTWEGLDHSHKGIEPDPHGQDEQSYTSTCGLWTLSESNALAWDQIASPLPFLFNEPVLLSNSSAYIPAPVFIRQQPRAPPGILAV
jgi:hypothetical protein